MVKLMNDGAEMPLSLAVIGSRTFTDREFAFAWIQRIHDELGPFDQVVSGGARGADALAEVWAKRNDISIKIYPADWAKHGKRAGFVRNIDIIEHADFILAFWDGESRGTGHSVKIAKSANKPLLVIDTSTGEVNKEISTVEI